MCASSDFCALVFHLPHSFSFLVSPTHLLAAELLLGPTFATSRVLQEMKLSLNDIGVIEFHEAFAGQVR